MQLFVVDDDKELCSMLGELLRQKNFSVEFEHNGAQGLRRVLTGTFDLVILDAMLPGLDGFEILRQLRAESEVPVMMLTAKGERGERVRGLQLGADDYLPKPFDPEELLARVFAILRRASMSRGKSPEAVQAGELRLSPGERDAYFRDTKLGLTAMECDILGQLMRSYGQVVSRDQLSLQLYNRPATAFDRSVDTHVSRIRGKLGAGRGMILSVRGTGYQLRRPSDPETT